MDLSCIRILTLLLDKKYRCRFKLTNQPVHMTEYYKGLVLNTLLQRRISGSRRNDLLEMLMDFQNAHYAPKYAVEKSTGKVAENYK